MRLLLRELSVVAIVGMQVQDLGFGEPGLSEQAEALSGQPILLTAVP